MSAVCSAFVALFFRLPPCTEAESGLLSTFMDLFVDCVSAAHNKLRGEPLKD